MNEVESKSLAHNLLPCPFCGGAAEMLHYESDGYLVLCPACQGMVENWVLTEEEAAAVWNRRPKPPECPDDCKYGRNSDKCDDCIRNARAVYDHYEPEVL